MQVRPFEWRDFPLLHRYRNECVYLNSALALTRGPIFVPTGALLSPLAYATGIFTYLFEQTQENVPLVAQASHVAGHTSAQMSYIAPRTRLDFEALACLMEGILSAIGERGALYITAEVEEQSKVLEILRHTGFGVYARQRIWRLKMDGRRKESIAGWRSAGKQDEAGIRFLYAELVPGLVQQVETLPPGKLRGLVYYKGSEMLAYVDMEYGLSGILAQPFIHPDAEDIAGTLVTLLRNLPDFYSRPVYVRVRSYQSWLEALLEEHDAQVALNQAVMVRYLTATRRVTQVTNVPALNGSKPEPTVPVARIEGK